MKRYIATIKLTVKEKLSGGLLALYASYAFRLFYLVPLLYLWRGLFQSGVVSEMTLPQMLSYTYISALLTEQLNVRTPMSGWLSGDGFINACKRPTHILADFTAQTVGGWLQTLLLFSLPLALAAPLLGVPILPKTIWFLPSLLLCVSLGFAIDFIFACFILRLKNATWLAYSIRMAVTYLFSGSLIPFALLPWGIGNWLRLSPFGSLAGAPLAIFTGIEAPLPLLAAQLFWNLAIWPLTILYFNKSRERMVSHGG
ncbi:MAG: hypothetical protein FWH26_07285 [Oscillospiraceae bacterium]|nr:hypothetical protein [Oscillospiraceae bacterium]